MATTWKAPTWRMPNEKNQNKFESYSVNFNSASSESIDCGNVLNTTFAGSFSVSAWVKSSNQNAYAVIASKSNTNNGWSMQMHGVNNKFYFNINDGSWKSAYFDLNPIDDGLWRHVVGTFDGTNIKIYVDNVKGTDATAGTMQASSSSLFIGSAPGSTGFDFNGEISNVIIFDYALSEPQISSLYNSGSPINPMTLKPAPIAYYPLGGNASTGGDPLTATTPNTLSVPNVAVPDASVFDFDASSTQYISIPNYTQIGRTQELSISIWAKFTDVTAYYDIIGNRNGSNNGVSLIIFQNTLYFIMADGTNDSFNNSNVSSFSSYVSNNEWCNILATYDGTDSKIFINGELRNTWTPTQPYTISGWDNSFLIGIRPIQLSSKFDGQLSNAVVWDSGQSSEALNIYNSGVPATTYTNTPTAWYKLDQSANWEADTTGEWQIPDAVSSYPQSFNFDGSSFMNFGTSLGNLLGDSYAGDLTFSTWIKLPPSSNNQKGIFCIDNINQPEFGLVNFTNQIWLYTSGNGVNIARFSTSIEDNNWHHLVLVYDADDASNTKLYIDNTPASKTVINSQPASLNFNGDNTVLGTYYNTAGTFDLTGKLSNSQIWNTALSSTQVETLYNNGVPLTTAIATDNLKAWYKLNDNEIFDGTNWEIENKKYPASFDSALNFNSSYIQVPDSDSLSFGNGTTDSPFSISAWIKTTNGSSRGIMSKWGNSPQGYEWLFWAYNNKISLVLYNNDSSGNYRRRAGNTSINNGKWTHVLVTYDGRGESTANQGIKIYINGVEESSYTDFSSGSYTAMKNTIRPVNIGAYNNGSTFVGEMSNVAIFNTDLDSTAITALYNNGTPETSISSSPISWWKLDNTTTGIQDSIGSNNGTNNGTTKVNTFVSTETGVSSGMTEQNLVNNNVSALNGESSGMDTSNLVTSTLTRQIPYNSYSLNFDGIDDMVEINRTLGSGVSEISISSWVKYNVNVGVTNKYYPIVAKMGPSFGNSFQLQNMRSGSSNNGGELYFNIHTANGSSTAFSGFVPSQGVWYNIVGTYDGSNVKIYVDGVLKGTQNATGNINSNTEFLMIGDSGYGGYSVTFNGEISNTSIFNEALTSTEVMKLYNSGVPSDLSSFNPQPVSWWSLGSDSYFNGSNYICPDLISTNNGTSSGMDANSLVGDAPNSTANGTSTNMTIDANLTGNAPNSSNNSFSVNMDYRDRVSGSGDVPG